MPNHRKSRHRNAWSPIVPGVGVGETGWREESFLIVGNSRDVARALGRRYGQNAIVAGRTGEPAALVYC